jgi:hypothetical protein
VIDGSEIEERDCDENRCFDWHDRKQIAQIGYCCGISMHDLRFWNGVSGIRLPGIMCDKHAQLFSHLLSVLRLAWAKKRGGIFSNGLTNKNTVKMDRNGKS